MLSERWSDQELGEILLPREKWHPFPVCSERGEWRKLLGNSLNAERKGVMVGYAEALLDADWPQLKASEYMMFIRDGNRSIYERKYFERRGRLGALVMAECLEGKGRFLDEIINGLWLICDEASWCVPAHNNHGAIKQEAIARYEDPFVDLFAAETAMVMAEAWYLLRSELDKVSPLICERVRKEILRRAVDPVIEKKNSSWREWSHNWNPWCSSNVLGAGYYVLDDQEKVVQLTRIIMESTDCYLAGQLPDGGCSEGPGYWSVSTGCLILILEEMYQRSQGKIDVYDQPLIRNMAEYRVKVSLDGPWQANFSDGGAKGMLSRYKCYRLGERVGCETMKNMVLTEMRHWNPGGEVDPAVQFNKLGANLNNIIREFFWLPKDINPVKSPRPVDSWMPDLQVMVARQTDEAGKGLVVAAKAGNNAEHHNHNDIGQFILMKDGQPLIVDVGACDYTRNTFNENRYKHWALNSSGHNVPIVNGVMQKEGGEFKATDVNHESDDGFSSLTQELKNAYPAGAGINSLVRKIGLTRGENAALELTDTYELQKPDGELTITFITPDPCVLEQPGKITLEKDGVTGLMEYDASLFEVKIEEFEHEDNRMLSCWGRTITKIVLTHKAETEKGSYSVKFS